jgi:hypothetical protein
MPHLPGTFGLARRRRTTRNRAREQEALVLRTLEPAGRERGRASMRGRQTTVTVATDRHPHGLVQLTSEEWP